MSGGRRRNFSKKIFTVILLGKYRAGKNFRNYLSCCHGFLGNSRQKKLLHSGGKCLGKCLAHDCPKMSRKTAEIISQSEFFVGNNRVFINDAFSATKIKLPGKVGRVGTLKSMNE